MQHVNEQWYAVIFNKHMHIAFANKPSNLKQTQRAVHVHRDPDDAQDIYCLTRRSSSAPSRLVAVIHLRTYCSLYTCSSHPPPVSLKHIHLSIPPFGTLTAPDGQVGRLRQVPVVKSPSPVALLLSVKKWVMDTTVLGIQSFSEITADHQPHLTCLFPLRFLRVAVASPFTERVQNAQSTIKRFAQEKISRSVNV